MMLYEIGAIARMKSQHSILLLMEHFAVESVKRTI
jgi:hypothetical protein